MRRDYLAALASVALATLTACHNGRQESAQPTDAAKAHAEWRATLTDSIDSLNTQSDMLRRELEAGRGTLDSLAACFDVIDNPVLVEKYRVYRGWKGHDTTSGTGVLARLLENNSIELIATLKGGEFSSVRFSCEGKSAVTPTVTPDGANNYSVAGVNRVAFTGAEVDSVAKFVADHSDSDVSMTFAGKGRPVSITLNRRQKEMIAATWRIKEVEMLIRRIEAQIPVLSSKMELFRAEVESDNSK